MPLLESSFGGWQPAGPAAADRALPAATQPARREVVLVDKPGAAQSEIRIGRVGVARSTPDYFPLLGTTGSSPVSLGAIEAPTLQ